MLSKPATLLLGLISKNPLNAYEIIKILINMNVKWWLKIGNSTVYTTIKTLEKRGLVIGKVKKDGNMPDKTIYSITENGRVELYRTLRNSFVTFDYDTNIFNIAAFFLDCFQKEEQVELLKKRLDFLNNYLAGIRKHDTKEWENATSIFHVANVQRMTDIILAEINGTQRILHACLKS